jgi:hypothetical protein
MMSHEAMRFPIKLPHAEPESAGRYAVGMTDLHVHIPDEVAQRLATAAAQRGTSTEDVSAEVLTLHAPARTGDGLGFIALAHAKAGFSARAAEELLEAEGFA